MEPYQLTEDAEKDLREVARYALNEWGKEALQEYRGGLKMSLRRLLNMKSGRTPFQNNSQNC